MKKVFYKLIFIFLLLVNINGVSALADQNLSVKLSTSPDSSYNDVSIDVVNNNNTLLDFKVQTVMEPMLTGSYSIAFPSGFEYVGKSLSSSASECNGYEIVNSDNSTFTFNINSIGSFCIYDFIITYKVTNSANTGNKTISIIDLNSHQINHSLNVGITQINTLTKAETVDSDNNGFIDKYKLTFSTGGLTGFSNTNLTVGGITPTLDSVSNNIAYISFDNNTFYTGEKPQIIDTDGNIFNSIGVINSSTISEEDKASPVVLTVNGTNIIGVGSPSINISQNNKLVIKFSENMLSSSLKTGFTITENGTDITNSDYVTFNENNGDTVYYCLGGYDINGDCVGIFDSNKTYSINIKNSAIDLNSNNYNGAAINVNINVSDSTPPIASSVTYNGETNNGIIINGITNNNNYTNSSIGNVNISLSGTDNSGNIESVCISETLLTNDNSCDTGWKTYSSTKSFTFSGSEGLKTLYIKFKDSAGNISNVYNDSIIWDKSNPSSSSNPNGGYFINGNINITINCSDSISSCTKIFYTTDGTTPTTSSSFILPGNNINISGNNETKTLKFFSSDIVGNLEGTTNIKNFIFGDSYVGFSSPILSTSNNIITLTGTCNYALGSNNIEYSLNGSSFTSVSNDNCDLDNTWSNDFSLNSNSSNTLTIRLKNDTSVNSSINVIHDNISPSSISLSINNNDSYASSNNVVLTISASDSSGVNQMCISNDSGLTNDNNCNGSSWETYSNSKNYTLSSGDGTKNVYIKFKDNVGNISSVTSDSIIVNSSTPTINSSLASGNHTGEKTITLTSSDKIYYTIDGTNPTKSSTLYSTPLNFGNKIENIVLKAIAYSNSGLSSGTKTYTYNFGCFPNSVSNGTVSSYPTCKITCNSGYSLNGNSCIKNSSSSSGGSSGGGGGGTTTNNIYEDISNIKKTKITLEGILKDETLKKYGILDLSKLSSNKITGDNGIINLRTNLKSKAYLEINENTSIIGNQEEITAPYSLDIYKYLKVKTLKVNNIDFKGYNIKKLYFVGNKDKNIEFDKEVDLYFNLGSKIEGEIYSYYSENVDGNFETFETGLKTDEDGVVHLKTNKLGYFIFIRDIYINKYLGEDNFGGKNIKNQEELEEFITDLKANLNNNKLIPIIEELEKKLDIPEIYYYISFDEELKKEYNNAIGGFSNYIKYSEKYLDSKDENDKSEVKKAYEKFNKILNLNKFEERYITKSNQNNLEIYKSNYTKISKVTDKLEKIVLNKYKKLLDSNTISEETYKKAIEDYNEFILHLTIFKQYKNKEASNKALVAAKNFIKIYNRKIVENQIIQESVEKKLLIKDKYYFPSELKFGMYKKEVQNLQEIMKSYGYFNYEQTTMYFGNVTKESLINFSKEILNTPNPEGVLTNDLIEKLYLIEYKN